MKPEALSLDRRIIVGRDAEIGKWVADRCENINWEFAPGTYSAIGVAVGDRLVAGCVYSDYQPDFGTMELSFAADSPKWAARRIIHMILAFPFDVYRCQRLSAVTSENNTRAIRLLEGVGFKREAVVERAYGRGHNAVLHRLFREDWELGQYGRRIIHG